MRKFLEWYAHVRPCEIKASFIQTKHLVMDLVMIRENKEDFHAGIAHKYDLITGDFSPQDAKTILFELINREINFLNLEIFSG
jgi:isocitrate/isopropylmalate dehydrogenase